jgi:hypothetical protein
MQVAHLRVKRHRQCCQIEHCRPVGAPPHIVVQRRCDVRQHLPQPSRRQQAPSCQLGDRETAAVAGRLVQGVSFVKLLHNRAGSAPEVSSIDKSVVYFAHEITLRVRYCLPGLGSAALLPRTCNTLSRTSPPAAAGSRPVTLPIPLAADHLHASSVVLDTSSEMLSMLHWHIGWRYPCTMQAWVRICCSLCKWRPNHARENCSHLTTLSGSCSACRSSPVISSASSGIGAAAALSSLPPA